MKYRYVIEPYSEDGVDGYILSEATPSDPNYRVGSGWPQPLEEVKALAQSSVASFDQETILRWKPAPEGWNAKDTWVSQYVDDGVEENV